MSHQALLVLNQPPATQPTISKKMVSALVDFKASENRNDPMRQQDRHGPYEELTLRKTGKLSSDYYEDGNDEPWGLRVQESRSNILWQVLSGAMDKHPDFASNRVI
jgi:hypothetical protein